MTSRLPITRPIVRAPDLDATVFENVDIALHELLAASMATGVPLIHGRTFRGCRLVGPAIVMAALGTTFDDTNFGDPRGDNRNLVLRPLGVRATGAIVMQDCVVDGCEFSEVGFTGSDSFIDWIIGLKTTPEFGSLS
jgi:hypothetical protein